MKEAIVIKIKKLEVKSELSAISKPFSSPFVETQHRQPTKVGDGTMSCEVNETRSNGTKRRREKVSKNGVARENRRRMWCDCSWTVEMSHLQTLVEVESLNLVAL